MGADHRRPLAAFVLLAVVAAILLVTSVRSNADADGSPWQSSVVASLVAQPPNAPSLLTWWVGHGNG